MKPFCDTDSRINAFQVALRLGIAGIEASACLEVDESAGSDHPGLDANTGPALRSVSWISDAVSSCGGSISSATIG